MLADYQTLTDNLVRDDTAKITTADRDRALVAAFARYGKDRPDTRVEDLVGAGNNELALPAGWQDGFSALKSLEHPVGDVPPTFIAAEFYRLYQKPATTVIQLDSAIGVAEAVRATYTVRHQVDAGTDTIPVDDREPIASYAAAILLDELAAFFSGASDSTIQADAVDHRSRGDQYASRASRLRKFYFDQLGIDPKREVAAGTTVALDVRDSLGGVRLTHGLRR